MTEERTMLQETDEWLAECGLAGSGDPTVTTLRAACDEMDKLNAGHWDLTDTARANARRAVRNAIKDARRALQPLVDEARTAEIVERHELRYSRLAARTLGWIDPRLLSDELRDAVALHLLDAHGVEMADYAPNPESV